MHINSIFTELTTLAEYALDIDSPPPRELTAIVEQKMQKVRGLHDIYIGVSGNARYPNPLLVGYWFGGEQQFQMNPYLDVGIYGWLSPNSKG